jgi:hypothetical protein
LTRRARIVSIRPSSRNKDVHGAEASLPASRLDERDCSAAPLDAAVRGDVERALASQYGAAIATTFVVDPTLIGGMRVQVGSDLYDGSVKAGLAALESSF